MQLSPSRWVPFSLCLVTAPLSSQVVQVSSESLRGLAEESQRALLALAQSQPQVEGAGVRRKAFHRLLEDAKAQKPLAALVDRKLAALERRYARTLDDRIRAAYHRRLISLSAEDLRSVARTRRVWRDYLLNTTTQLHFQKFFLQPATKVGKLLFPDVAKIRTKDSEVLRRCMLEFNDYREEVRKVLGLGDDPTTGVKASTGIPLPPLFEVRSYDEHLDHLHRTMAVASSVAPLEAQNILLANAEKARFIDRQEAEFVLYSNEIRMLMGTIAWATDTAACAATRDHSKDRVDGKAKGHWSSLPGKRGFTHRLRRFGTRGSSEGAGGGRNGRAYLHGLSYGGGHTGPLYSLKRNVVGVGRHGNTYTSTYAGNKSAVHTAAVLEGESFMPPGIPQADVFHPELTAVCNEIKVENYARAQELLADVSAKSKMDKFLKRYLRIAIAVEADWQLECIARIEAAGDLYGARQRIAAARAKFGSRLDKRLAAVEKRLGTKAAGQILAAGEAYAKACAKNDRPAIRAVVTEYAGTAYAKAAAAFLAGNKKKAHPLQWFLTVDKYLNRFEYLSR